MVAKRILVAVALAGGLAAVFATAAQAPRRTNRVALAHSELILGPAALHLGQSQCQLYVAALGRNLLIPCANSTGGTLLVLGRAKHPH
jgi:hypothetical protein